MKTVLASAIAILSLSTSTAFSQTAGTGQPNAAGAAQGNLPESMRIQQQVTKKDLADPKALITKGGAATTEAPGAARSPIESNRLDPAAPSRQRLQIDEGASARAVQNPGANGANPGNTTGNSFNTVIEGSPSNNGTSTGVSGTAPSSTSGALTSPSGSVTPSVSPSGASGTSGRSSGSASGTSSSGGSAGGGASGGGGSH
jgi:hypothetical protein